MESPAPMAEGQRAEEFREFQAEHLRRQTAAVESVRAILLIWSVFAVLGVVVYLVASTQGGGL